MTDNFSRLEASAIREAVASKRFLAQDRVQVGIQEIATWDRYLLRESRLLVPVDLQALYVPVNDTEQMVRLPMQLTTPAGTEMADAMPAPFDEGSPRPAGVHLHWAMPDALLRGELSTAGQAGGNKLGLPPLPDRWVVLRLLYDEETAQPKVAGWVLEANRAAAVPLAEWSEGGTAKGTGATGVTLAPTELTGTVGGSVHWASTYDAVLNRFAFHDPLADATGLQDGDLATYLVAGWWSSADLDPLDSARGKDSLDELLETLRWRPVRDWGDQRTEQEHSATQEALRKALGLTTAERFITMRPGARAGQSAAGRSAADAFVPKDSMTSKSTVVSASSFSADSPVRYIARPWHLRSSLLHGSVYGVPVAGGVDVDSRPDPTGLKVALGQHNDDVLAALGALPGTTPSQRRDAERLLEAFTQQKLNRIDTPDGLTEIEETEHTASFANVPSGEVAATDRFAQRVVTGGGGGRKLGKHREVIKGARGLDATAPGRVELNTEATLTFTRQPDLRVLSESEAFREMYDKTDEILSAIEPRIVERPAARYTFATDPLVGLRGAKRSLRHGGDGRGSADAKLSCRWPHHAYEDIPGIVSGSDLIRTLGNGSIPTEVLRLAREAAVHDPYHDDWLALSSPPVRDRILPATLAFNRLRAESLMRFGLDGTYDGATDVFLDKGASTGSKRGDGRRALPLFDDEGRRPGSRGRHLLVTAVGATLARVERDRRGARPGVRRGLGARPGRPAAGRRHSRRPGRQQPYRHRPVDPDHGGRDHDPLGGQRLPSGRGGQGPGRHRRDQRRDRSCARQPRRGGPRGRHRDRRAERPPRPAARLRACRGRTGPARVDDRARRPHRPDQTTGAAVRRAAAHRPGQVGRRVRPLPRGAGGDGRCS